MNEETIEKNENDAPQTSAAAWTDAEGNFTREDWTPHESVRAKFSSVQKLADSYRELEVKMGPGDRGLKVPPPDAPQAELDAFYNALGRPPDAAQYNFEKPFDWPADVAWSHERLNAFKTAAHEAGLSQGQFEGLVKWANAYEGEHVRRMGTHAKECHEAAMEKLRADPEFGGAALNRTIASARRVATRFDADDLVNDPKIGNDPRFVRLLARIGKDMAEDGFDTARIGGGHPGGDLRGRLDSILSDRDDAYWNKMDPRHDERVREVVGLQRRLAQG